jgi:hypothetical protein
MAPFRSFPLKLSAYGALAWQYPGNGVESKNKSQIRDSQIISRY